MKKIKILLIGAYPPPYGGISVHIKRLYGLLKNKYNIKILDFSKNNIEKNNNPNIYNFKYIYNKFLLIFNDSNIVHIHISSKQILLGLLLSQYYRLCGKKTIITYHSFRNNINVNNHFKFYFYSFLLRNVNRHIAVSKEIKNKLLTFNISYNTIKILPGFIPPKFSKSDLLLIPEEINNFIKNHKPIISANAYKIVFYENIDLYGIDFLIKVLNKLKITHPNIGLIIAIPNLNKEDDYYHYLIDFINNNNLNNNILIYSKQCEFYPILLHTDIFVRPTITDGDSISIREALFFNVKTIASNVVKRPRGTIVINNRNEKELIDLINSIINSNNIKKEKIIKTNKYIYSYSKIYKL